MAMFTCDPGETLTAKTVKLVDRQSGPVTTGATVTFVVVDANENIIVTGTGTVEPTTNNWYYDFNAPDDVGDYLIHVTNTVGSVIGKGTIYFGVRKPKPPRP